MRNSKIMFSNLRAEMARKEITIIEISKLLGVNRDTVSRKLSGKSKLYLNEAMLINKEFFPNKELPYLFQELLPKKKQNAS